MDYIMGLSGADSITTVNIATITGVVVQSFTVGAINFFFASEDEAGRNLAEAFITAQMAGYPVRSCRQVCAGVAGLQRQTPNTKLDPALRGVMRRCGYSGDALLLGNEQIALAGALDGQKGAILLAEDTSVCFGQNRAGAQHRTGGMGVLSDDDGSTYAIGREILRAVARASDGRSPSTILIQTVYRQFHLASQADLARLLRGGTPTRQEICALAASLAAACHARDSVALSIVEKAVNQLAGLVAPVVRRLMLQKGKLAVAGSVLLNDAFTGQAFKKRIAEIFPDLECVPPRHDGAVGAVLLAKERLALRGWR